MTLHVYNTLTRKKELFTPVSTGKVKMYVCGPTVYDSCHVGHARSVVVFDVIARYLKESGYDLTYVRNFTDIDDKIIEKALLTGAGTKEIAEKYIAEFYEDMDSLNVKRADVEPKATEHIDSIVELISILIDKDAAYAIDGDVYYSVESFNNYGRLSGRKLEDMEAGARVDIDARKKTPFDFALWKSAKPDEPYWSSPWGDGRPGWHIECSAMSRKFLGETFDIHGGGKDLIFPHHENEIAQSAKAFGKTFVKYWLHNGFINIEKEKMSKSLGNFLTIKEMLEKYHPDTIRLFLLSNHYRSPIEFSDKNLEEAETGINKIYNVMQRMENIDSGQNNHGEYLKLFCESMDDDFNTARGVGVLFNAVRALNKLMDHSESVEKEALISIKSDIDKIGEILGILSEKPSLFFERKKEAALKKKNINSDFIEALIAERTEARRTKDWAKADKIRDRLNEMGVVTEDTPDGVSWKFGKN